MQFSESWLRTLVDPDLSTQELSHLLTMSGLEVEECREVGPPLAGVVVGKILSFEKHPNADRLKVCQVDVGQGAALGIVCGAPNVVQGMRVPCALVGARLPAPTGAAAPLEIKAATMRGVESAGMLCSARELGLSDDHSGLLDLGQDAPVGASVSEVLALDDHIFLVKLTPNRADCLSVLGIAREVRALTGATLKLPDIPAVRDAGRETFPVRISAPDGCGRFTGRVIRHVDAKAPTPAWMKQRLERAGQRSISALVDVTNYVMLELGRPLHVYDLDKLKGGIDVRFGRKGETLKLLNEQTVELDESVLAITDASGPIGLAGIMGGDSTKADLETRNVFLEAAFFFPDAIAGRARRFNFSSDASHRFERGVDFDNNVAGIERATALILEICGGEAGPVADTVAKLPERPPVRVRVARAQRIIGVPVEANEMADHFSRLGFQSRREGTGASEAFVVTPPSFRFDIQIEEDLIEEVARMHGFERIPANPPSALAVMKALPEGRRTLHQLRERLASADYQEVVNYSFVEEAWEKDFAGNDKPLRLLNPIASQLAVMRSSLIGGLVANVRYNLNRKLDRVRVFEIGRAFLRDTAIVDGELSVAGILQPTRVSAAAFGSADEEQWSVAARGVDFYDVKGDVEALLAPAVPRFEPSAHPSLHPGRSARVILDNREIGWVGELHPALQRKYELPAPMVLFELEAEPLLARELPRFEEVSKFPAVRRDLAVTLDDEIPAQTLLDTMMATRPAIVDAISVFDVYRGKGIEKGKKGLAFRVLLQDTQKTLTDAEVDAAMAVLLDVLEKKFSGKRRQ
ncbi:MAG TPA: phenylalanine--tRNA ligase subunit beta [Burkholderiales bacterium]|nr:phenylalanine--tRNA ligase subunit beta [Burkholderiales bacterium]